MDHALIKRWEPRLMGMRIKLEISQDGCRQKQATRLYYRLWDKLQALKILFALVDLRRIGRLNSRNFTMAFK